MREGMVIGGDSGGKRREGDNKRGREGMGGDRNGWEGLLIWLWGMHAPGDNIVLKHNLKLSRFIRENTTC